MGNVANLNSIVSVLDHYSQLTGNSPSSLLAANSSAKFGLSQLLSSVSSLNQPNRNHHAESSALTDNHSSANAAYSPFLSVIDYIQSLQTPRYAAKRKTTNDLEDLLPDQSDKQQTPCSSSEEYISPTFARNYQGVWKYVVQIPNEGYFTQTIQQTTCL